MGSNKKILVVDDELDILEVVAKRLISSGYEIITASDGQEAFDKARKENPDLIILDLMLPKMDGYKVCGLLKRDARYANIPVILFTARAQGDDMKMGQEVGADAYITKPFESQVLLGKIKELLKEQ
ncbi:MAG: response regulator [Candidatus Omnitrophota bacterium]